MTTTAKSATMSDALVVTPMLSADAKRSEEPTTNSTRRYGAGFSGGSTIERDGEAMGFVVRNSGGCNWCGSDRDALIRNKKAAYHSFMDRTTNAVTIKVEGHTGWEDSSGCCCCCPILYHWAPEHSHTFWPGTIVYTEVRSRPLRANYGPCMCRTMTSEAVDLHVETTSGPVRIEWVKNPKQIQDLLSELSQPEPAEVQAAAAKLDAAICGIGTAMAREDPPRLYPIPPTRSVASPAAVAAPPAAAK